MALPMAPVIFAVRLRVSADHVVAFDRLIDDMNAAATGVGRATSIEVATAEDHSDVAARGKTLLKRALKMPGDPYGNRTRASAVKGPRPNR